MKHRIEFLDIIKKERINFLIGFILLIGFICITYMVCTGLTQHLDEKVHSFFIRNRSVGLNTFFESITYCGNWEFITSLCILLFAFDKTRKKLAYPVITMAVTSFLLNRGMKCMIMRARPDEMFHLIKQGGFSFPSGHSATATAVFGILIYVFIKNSYFGKKTCPYSWGLFLLIVLICCSRLYLGVHYLTDVWGGIIEGMALLFFVVPLMKQKNIISVEPFPDQKTHSFR